MVQTSPWHKFTIIYLTSGLLMDISSIPWLYFICKNKSHMSIFVHIDTFSIFSKGKFLEVEF